MGTTARLTSFTGLLTLFVSLVPVSAEGDGGSKFLEKFERCFFINTGVVALNPYEIEGDSPNFRLKSGGQDANIFVEAAFRDRLAWLRPRGDNSKKILPDWGDMQVRGGYTFSGTGKPQAAAVVGSGDGYLEIFLGINLWQYPKKIEGNADKSEASQKNEPSVTRCVSWSFPELGFSVVSDREVQDIHDRSFLGTSLSFGFCPSDTQCRPIECIVRGGLVRLEQPNLIGDTNMVAAEHGFPDFDDEWGTYALDFEFNVPLSDELKAGYLTMRGSFHGGLNPNPWSFHIGLTSPAATIVDWLGKAVEKVF